MKAKTPTGKHEVGMLAETRDLLDELLETLDILGDADALKALDEARADARRGRLHGLADL